jgi:hypothetical protein
MRIHTPIEVSDVVVGAFINTSEVNFYMFYFDVI